MSAVAEKNNPEWAAATQATGYLIALSKNLPRQLYTCHFTRWIWLFGKPAILVPEPSENAFIDAACLLAQADGIAIRITRPQTVCIKFLNCVRNGKPNIETRNFLKLFAGNYIEFTPDRTGVQVFSQGSAEPGSYGQDKNISVITQDSEQYVSLTADVYEPSIDRHLWYGQQGIDALLEMTATRKSHHPKPGSRQISQTITTDSRVILKALGSKNKAKFQRLWNGDHSGYKSVVRADLALIGILKYWTDGDRAQTDRLYRMSGMYRDSWDNRRVKDIPYGQATLNYVFLK